MGNGARREEGCAKDSEWLSKQCSGLLQRPGHASCQLATLKLAQSPGVRISTCVLVAVEKGDRKIRGFAGSQHVKTKELTVAPGKYTWRQPKYSHKEACVEALLPFLRS